MRAMQAVFCQFTSASLHLCCSLARHPVRVCPGLHSVLPSAVILPSCAGALSSHHQHGRSHSMLSPKCRCGTCDGSGVKPGTTASTCSACGGAGQQVSAVRTPLGMFQQVRVDSIYWT
jgi:hypothetical protein